MTSLKVILKCCGSAAALACLAPIAAHAQSSAPTGVEDVVVTAQKRSQALQDVSVAVTAIDGRALSEMNINNIEDLQKIVPSIYMGNDFHMAKTFIRGVGANTSTTGSETGVALHVDGAFVARAEAQLTSLFDLERVEVLRGPQGTLYGRNAVGGSINLITAKPTTEPMAYVQATIGNYQAIYTEGAISGPIVGDTVLGRIAVKSENRGGYGENPATGNDVDDLSRVMGRAHLMFVPNARWDVLLTGEYYNQNDSSGALHFRRAAFPTAPNRLFPIGQARFDVVGGFATRARDLASEHDPDMETETWALTGTVNWRLNDAFTLTNIMNYREIEGFITQDLDLSSRVNGASQPAPANNSSVQRRDIKSEQFSDEQQIRYAGEWLNGVVGIFYYREDQNPVDTVGFGPVLGEPNILPVLADPSIGALPPPFPTGYQVDGINLPAQPVPLSLAHALCNTAEHHGGNVTSANLPPKRVCINSDLSSEAWAIFGQFNIRLTETLALKLGGRYSHEKVSATSRSLVVARNGFGPVLLTTAAGNLNERTFTDFSPEAGVEWSPTEDLLLYYTYSQGFKAGAGENNQGPVTAAVNFRSIIVDPEEIENHEVGVKSSWFDGRLIVNVAAFTYDLEGQQINKTLAGGPAGFSTLFQNAASTTADGVEIEFAAVLSDSFRLNGALNWLDSRYVDFLTKDPLDPRNIATPGPCPPGDPPETCFVPPSGVPDVQLAGNRTRNSPEWAAYLHVEFDLPRFDVVPGTLTLTGDVAYRDDVFFTEFERLIEGQEAYTILDFALRFVSDDDKMTASVWLKNATDELVASSTFQISTGRAIGVTYLPPRTYGLTIGYRF